MMTDAPPDADDTDDTPPPETFTPDDDADFSGEPLGPPAEWLADIPADAGSDTPAPVVDDE